MFSAQALSPAPRNGAAYTASSRPAWIRCLQNVGVLLLPLATVIIGLLPHLSRLSDNTAEAHPHWWDAMGHLYLCWERFRSLTFQQGFFDFLWYYPYANTGTYNEPSLTQGLLFGVFSLFTAGEPLAFNLGMATIVLLNAIALYVLTDEMVNHRWVAVIFATVGGLSPFAWVRYAHPPNTVIFWGLLGLYFVSKASSHASWRNCLAALAMFVIQAFSSFYVSMFFVIPLLFFVPAALVKSVQTKQVKRLLLRGVLATLLFLPFLFFLTASYTYTRTELNRKNTYEYVSRLLPRTTTDYLDVGPIACHLRALGITEDKNKCRGEMFPGRLVIAGTVLALILAVGHAAAGKWLTRSVFVRSFLVVVGLTFAVVLRESWPFHLAVWANLWLPVRGKGCLAVRSPIAVPLVTALVVADIACNPTVRILGIDFGSIHRIFYSVIPGFDGLRTEYRIAVLLPPLMAMIGAHGLRGLLQLSWLRKSSLARVSLLVSLTLCCVVEGQPRWQDYRYLGRSDRPEPVLSTVARLPSDAAVAVVKGRGPGIARRNPRDACYFVAFPVIHKHPQITGYSTYDSPAAVAIERAERLNDHDARLKWASRLAYLFGGTHLIVHWRREQTPHAAILQAMAAVIGSETHLVSADSHLALFRLGTFADVSHGPVSAPRPAGNAVRPLHMRASTGEMGMHPAYDDHPHSAWNSGFLQRRGQWVSLHFGRKHTFQAIGFTPGLRVESVPLAYTIEALTGANWESVASVRKWTVTQDLIERPGTGHIVVAFPKTSTDRLRIRIDAATPWPLRLADVVGYVSSSK